MIKWLQNLFAPKFVLRRDTKLIWSAADGKYLREFVNTGTGIKLTAMCEDAIFASAMDTRISTDMRAGMIRMYKQILSYQAPPEQPQDNESESDVIQE